MVVAGGSNISTGRLRAFRWTQATGMMDLGIVSGGQTAFGIGLSGDGSVVVGWATNSIAVTQPFRWTAATGMVDIGTLGGDRGMATDTNSDGSVVVGWARNSGGLTRAFRWTSGGMVDIGTLAARSEAHGVSATGDVVVGWSVDGTNTVRAFRWTEPTGMVSLGGFTPDDGTMAFSTNADGSMVVGRSFGTGDRAFLWTPGGGMQDLNDLYASALPSGWIMERADGVSSDGRYIVGAARHSGGEERAFILDTVPEPGTLTALLLGSGWMLLRRSRRRCIIGACNSRCESSR